MMKTTTNFLAEEKEWINGQIKDRDLNTYRLTELRDAAAIMLSFYPDPDSDPDGEEQMLHEFAINLSSKLDQLTDILWEQLKPELPFDLCCSVLDEPPADPADY